MRFGFYYEGRKGRYQLQGELGEGGFGCVHRADGPAGPVALKVLHDPLEPDARRRFVREHEILEPLRHPNIIEVVDHGVDEEGRPWFVMPVMEGGPLSTQIGQMADALVVLRVVGDVAKALACIHGVGGMHSDVKPENILLDDTGKARLADFGLARVPALTGYTMTRSAMGTLGYMAPEVFRSESCQASDVYALGVVLWELVHGERHQVPSLAPQMDELVPELELLEQTYVRMVHVDPSRRPSAQEVATVCDQLEALLLRPKPEVVVVEKSDPFGDVLKVVGGVALFGVALAGVGAVVGALTED